MREQQKKEQEKETSLRQIKILTDIPCGDKFLTSCKFIKDAHNAKQDLSITKKVLSEVEDKLKLKAGELSDIAVDKVSSTINNWTRLTDKRKDEQSRLTNLNLDLKRTNSALQKLEGEIKELNDTADYYEEHKEVLENIEKVMSELELAKTNKERTEQELQDCEDQIYTLVGKEGALEKKLENLKVALVAALKKLWFILIKPALKLKAICLSKLLVFHATMTQSLEIKLDKLMKKLEKMESF